MIANVRLVGVVLAVAATGGVIGGCGGGTSTSSGGATVSTKTVPTEVHAAAYAHAVNLHAADLPDLRITMPEGPARLGAHEGAFARCVGETNPENRIAKVHSAQFRYPEGFGQVQSVVTVQPSEAFALDNLHASLEPRLLACLKSLLPSVLAGKTEHAAHYGRVSVSRLTGLSVPQSTGVVIRTSIAVPQLRYPVPITFDEFGFVVGPAEITLLTAGAPHPVAAEVEARLLSLLYSRAKAHTL